MMFSFVQFFKPYVLFLQGAAYNVAQTLEGLGIVSSNIVERDMDGNIIGSYWSPVEAYIPLLFGLLALFALLLCVSLVVSAYILGRRKGVFVGTFLLLFPGITSIFGLFPNVNYLPEQYAIHGTGILGSVWGMFPLVLLGLLTGWSMVLILSDVFDLRDRFRHYFDHFWYSIAVLAGLFFVADSGTSEVIKDLHEANQLSRQSSSYLLQQVKNYETQCKKLPSVSTASCNWASDVQQKLSDLAVSDERNFVLSGPKSTSDIYNPFGGNISPLQIQVIRRELKAYNNSRCPVKKINETWSQQTRPSGVCLRPPGVFCRSLPDPLDGFSDNASIFRSAAISSECIIPSLVTLRAKQEKLSAAVEESERTKHSRWLFFVMFSIIAGGKVANATSRAVELDRRNEQEKRRLWGLLRSMFSRIWKGLRLAIIWGRQFLVATIRWISGAVLAMRKR